MSRSTSENSLMTLLCRVLAAANIPLIGLAATLALLGDEQPPHLAVLLGCGIGIAAVDVAILMLTSRIRAGMFFAVCGVILAGVFWSVRAPGTSAVLLAIGLAVSIALATIFVLRWATASDSRPVPSRW